MSLLFLYRYNSSEENTSTGAPQGDGIIETDNIAVEFVNANEAESWIVLNITQKQYGKHEFLKLSLKSWDS